MWRQSFLQYGLRTLLILMLLSALAAGYCARFVEAYRRQSLAGEEMVKAGAALQWQPAKPAWLAILLRPLVQKDLLRDCVEVSAERAGLQDPDLVHLRNMPQLERLYLASNPLTDQAMEHLRDLQHLQRLSLWRTAISDEGLRHLGQLRELEVLDIHEVNVGPIWGSREPNRSNSAGYGRVSSDPSAPTGECLEYFADLKSLRKIHFSFPVNSRGLAVLARLPQLRIRSLLLEDMTPADIALLPSLADLNQLVLRRARFDEKSVQHLGRLKNLRLLWLEDVQSPPEAWRALEKLRAIEGLSLRHTKVDDQDLAGLRSLNAMRWIDLRDTPLTANCVGYLTGMRQLECLYFDCPLDDDAICALAELPKLRHVERKVVMCYLSDTGLAALAKMPFFQHVRLHDAIDGIAVAGINIGEHANRMTDEGMSRFWARRSFASASVYARDVTLGAFPLTTSHSNCRATLFSPRPLSELLVPRLAHAASEAQLGYKTITLEFPGQRGPSELVVHYTGHDGVRGLLRHLPEIERLKIEQGAAEVLSEDGWDDLRYVPNLEEFEAPLWHKPRTTLDAAAIRWLGEMKNLRNMTGALSAGLAPTDLQPLGQLKQLEELNLSCGLVTAEHLRFVAQLESLRKLSLTVRFHGFDDEHGLRYLSLLPRLDDLYLHQISDVGMTYLSNVKSVSRLSIDGPGVTVAGLKHLGELPNLKYLDIRWTGVTDEQLKAFADRHRSIIVRSDRGSQKRL